MGIVESIISGIVCGVFCVILDIILEICLPKKAQEILSVLDRVADILIEGGIIVFYVILCVVTREPEIIIGGGIVMLFIILLYHSDAIFSAIANRPSKTPTNYIQKDEDIGGTFIGGFLVGLIFNFIGLIIVLNTGKSETKKGAKLGFLAILISLIVVSYIVFIVGDIHN